MRSTTPPTSRRTACAITPATWRWCARATTKIPIVLASATPSVETEVNARRGRYARLHLPERFGGQHLPSIEAIDLRARRPAARTLHRAAARRSGEDRAGARRAGAAVPQPPRLCAADAVPRLRPSPGLPELRRLAGRSPLQAAAGLPPLRLLDAAAGEVPEMRGDGQLRRRSAPASSGWSRRRPSCFPARASSCCPAIWWNRWSGCAQELDDVARGPLRHRHRHAARRQGPPFPEAQSGRHRRCRSRPCQRRSARRRAHVPAAASGGRPRRPRGGPRLRLSADASARASGDARADRAGPRGVLRSRDRGAREDRLSAVRPAREPADLGRRQARDRKLCAQARGGRAARRAGARARPRRSAARGGARALSLPPAGEVAAQLRPLGLSARLARRRAEDARARSSSKSTSIRRVFSSSCLLPSAHHGHAQYAVHRRSGIPVARKQSRDPGLQRITI